MVEEKGEQGDERGAVTVTWVDKGTTDVQAAATQMKRAAENSLSFPPLLLCSHRQAAAHDQGQCYRGHGG